MQVFKIPKSWVLDLVFHLAPTPNGLRCWISSLSESSLALQCLDLGWWMTRSNAIAVDHTVLGAVGIASIADAISGATGAVTDISGNTFKGDLDVVSDSQRTPTLSSGLDR